MAENNSNTGMDKIDALAAMAEGKDIAKEGFNAPVQDEADAAKSADAAAAVLAAAQAASGAPSQTTTAESSPRKNRAATLKRQRQRVHAEQFKRMMVPMLIVTGILLMVLGGIVGFMMRGDPEMHTGSGPLHDPTLKTIMVCTAFVVGAILLIGAWMFRADLKRADKMAQREQSAREGD